MTAVLSQEIRRQAVTYVYDAHYRAIALPDGEAGRGNSPVVARSLGIIVASAGCQPLVEPHLVEKRATIDNGFPSIKELSLEGQGGLAMPLRSFFEDQGVFAHVSRSFLMGLHMTAIA